MGWKNKTSFAPKCQNTICYNVTPKGSDGRWRKFCSKSCKDKITLPKQIATRNATWADQSKHDNAVAKYKATSKKNCGVAHHMQMQSTKDNKKEKSLLEFGTLHHLQSDQVIEKRISTCILRGLMIDRNISNEFEIYRKKVWSITKTQYRKYKNKINPLNIKRSKNTFHLDHIYSISQGLKDKIPAKVIAHWTNLRIIDHKENILKRHRCDKTLVELFEDYNRENNKDK